MIDKEVLQPQLTLKLEHSLGSEMLQTIAEAADELGQEVRIVGGTVRDLILNRPLGDYDFVTEGSGPDLAEAIARRLDRAAHVTLFRNFGTAQVHYRDMDLEFVGARSESYHADSRKPIVEDGTFEEDEARRDFTINALSISLNGPNAGTLNDPFGGLEDLQKRVIRTPLDPDVTFSDDPLRMMRAVRFATQLDFEIADYIKASMRKNAERLSIVSMERISDEFIKIMNAPRPSIGLLLMDECDLMPRYLPEVTALKETETKEGIGHKNNFIHTAIVVDNVAKRSDKTELRLAALFHDIGKPVTKHFTRGAGWSFHNHDFIGNKMLPKIFRRIKLPLDERLKYVRKLVRLHMRPAQLADEGVTDSAIRRLLFEAGDDIEDLMTLCESDLTSKNPKKVRKYLDNFALVRQKLKEIEEKDRIRNFQPPIKGDEIMMLYGLKPCSAVGEIKEAIKEAILDGVIPNEREAAHDFMIRWAKENKGLTPVAE